MQGRSHLGLATATQTGATQRFTSALGEHTPANSSRQRVVAGRVSFVISLGNMTLAIGRSSGIQFTLAPSLYLYSGSAILIAAGACPAFANGSLPVHACYFEQVC